MAESTSVQAAGIEDYAKKITVRGGKAQRRVRGWVQFEDEKALEINPCEVVPIRYSKRTKKIRF